MTRHLKVSRFIVSRLLNHTGRETATDVYDRYDYLEERRAALAAWDRRLTTVLTETTDANVVAFARA